MVFQYFSPYATQNLCFIKNNCSLSSRHKNSSLKSLKVQRAPSTAEINYLKLKQNVQLRMLSEGENVCTQVTK